LSLAVSAFIICLNERGRIKSCIESLDGFAEIVVVDSGSTDGTVELLEDLKSDGWPIKLMHHQWSGYAAQKQFALEQCTQPWCLNIDADERLDAELRAQIPRLIENQGNVIGWRVARRPYLIGYGYTPHGVTERKNLRLIKSGCGSYDLSQTVHEGIVPAGKVAECKIGSLLHFTPTPIGQQILVENTYSSLKSQMIVDRDQPRTPWRMLYNPPLYFLRLYFRNGLWRCGFPGFIQAVTGAMYSFLTESKVFQDRAMQKTPPTDADP